MKLDSELQARREREPDSICQVVVVCSHVSNEVRSKIRQAGLEVTSLDLASSGLICGRIRIGDLTRLETVAEVQSISADSDQFAQGAG